MPQPSPALYQALGRHAHRVSVTVFNSVDSTNNAAKANASENTPALYIARTQTGGRGRLGRSFHSPAYTGLYMTVAYTTDRPLTEAVTREDGSHRMIVGLGINLTTTDFPEGLRAPAASLFTPEEAGTVPADLPDALAGAITRQLLELADPNATDKFPRGAWGEACLDFYRRHLLYVGETVVCTRGNESFSGTRRGVDGDYSLLVETDSGILTLSSGEISVRPVRNP